jgi:hypothetical protein
MASIPLGSTDPKCLSLFTARELAQINKCLVEDAARATRDRGQYVVELEDIVVKYISARITDAQTSAPPGEKLCILINGFPYGLTQWSAFWSAMEPKGCTPSSGDTMVINLPSHIKHFEGYFKTAGVRYVGVEPAARTPSVVGSLAPFSRARDGGIAMGVAQECSG